MPCNEGASIRSPYLFFVPSVFRVIFHGGTGEFLLAYFTPSFTMDIVKEYLKPIAWFLPAVLFPAYVLALILTCYVDIPFWDEWEFIPALDYWLKGDYSLSLLFPPHMGHRLVLTQLTYLIAYQFFHGHLLFVVLIQFVLKLLLLILLVRAAGRSLGLRPAWHAVVALVISALLFTPNMAGVWLWAFAIQQPFTTLFFTAAIFLFAGFATAKRWVLAGVVACGMLATLASANGLVVWPVLVAMSYFKRTRWQIQAGIASIGLLVSVAYFHHLLPPPPSPEIELFDRLKYILAFLGSMFSMDEYSVAICWGSLGLTLCIACVILFIVARRESRERALPWLALTGLPLASAFVGAFKRIAFSTGMDSRYLTLSALFWIGILVAFILLIRDRTPRWFLFGRAAIIFILLAMSLAYGQTTKFLFDYGNIMNDLRLSKEALNYDCYLFNCAPGRYTSLYPYPINVSPWVIGRWMIDQMTILKKHGLHPFDDGPLYPKLIGRRLDDIGRVVTNEPSPGAFTNLDVFPQTNQVSHLDKLDSIQPALEASGWVRVIDGRDSVMVCLADEEGIIRGLGGTGYDSFNPFFFMRSSRRNENRMWRGFVVKPTAGKVILNAYARYPGSPVFLLLDGTFVMH